MVNPEDVDLMSFDAFDGALSRDVLIASPDPKIPSFEGSTNILFYSSE